MSRHTADIRLIYGRHTADIRRVYGQKLILRWWLYRYRSCFFVWWPRFQANVRRIETLQNEAQKIIQVSVSYRSWTFVHDHNKVEMIISSKTLMFTDISLQRIHCDVSPYMVFNNFSFSAVFLPIQVYYTYLISYLDSN